MTGNLLSRFNLISRLGLCVAIANCFASSAEATTWIVDSRSDSVAANPGNCVGFNVNSCSLRDAIAASVSGDVISVQVPEVYLSSELEINTSVTIVGNGYSAAIDGQGKQTVFAINASTNVVLENLTIQDGYASVGAGIYNLGTLSIRNCTVSGNVATDAGAGIFNDGTLAIEGSTISGNTAALGGGGIYNVGVLTLSQSTVSGNSLNTSFIQNTRGAGILNRGFGNAPISLSNCTIANNQALGANSFGGGMDDGNAATVVNCTFAGNSANTGNGLYEENPFPIPPQGTTLSNTIVADGCAGTFEDAGGNLDSGTGCGFTNNNSISDAVLQLGALQDNGGPTWTILPGPGSQALGAGLNSVCSSAPVNSSDQRGVHRPQGTNCDSGAVELTDLIFADGFDGP